MALIKREVGSTPGQGRLTKSDWSGEFDAAVTESRTPIGGVRHLKIKRRDGRDGIGWDVLQSTIERLSRTAS